VLLTDSGVSRILEWEGRGAAGAEGVGVSPSPLGEGSGTGKGADCGRARRDRCFLCFYMSLRCCVRVASLQTESRAVAGHESHKRRTNRARSNGAWQLCIRNFVAGVDALRVRAACGEIYNIAALTAVTPYIMLVVVTRYDTVGLCSLIAQALLW